MDDKEVIATCELMTIDSEMQNFLDKAYVNTHRLSDEDINEIIRLRVAIIELNKKILNRIHGDA